MLGYTYVCVQLVLGCVHDLNSPILPVAYSDAGCAYGAVHVCGIGFCSLRDDGDAKCGRILSL